MLPVAFGCDRQFAVRDIDGRRRVYYPYAQVGILCLQAERDMPGFAAAELLAGLYRVV